MTADRSAGPSVSGSMSPPEESDSPDAPTGSNEPVGARLPQWLLFGSLAGLVIVADQLTKAWIVANVPPGGAVRLLGDELRLVITHNTGGVFGLFRDQASIFAIFSVAVMGLIVVIHGRSPASGYLSVTLGLLLGGAVGNFIDRIRLGHVIDFVDAGLGTVRFYTFNVADMAVSASLLLLIALSLRTALGGSRESGRGG